MELRISIGTKPLVPMKPAHIPAVVQTHLASAVGVKRMEFFFMGTAR